jgi:hypothetical protein
MNKCNSLKKPSNTQVARVWQTKKIIKSQQVTETQLLIKVN